jgi:tetratricopeptide (TPR) repeat protein
MRVFDGERFRWAAPWAMGALVFVVALGCYWPSSHGKPLWDDPAHITDPELRSWSGLIRIWTEVGATQEFYPVLHSAFWLEQRLWGDSTLGYHLVNVFLHAGSCCLLALILRRLWTPGRATQSTRTPAIQSVIPWGVEWVAALLFAVHPVCVESVAWITEQKNTLSLFFLLLATLAYLNFAGTRGRAGYWTALILFFFALAAKPSTVIMPAALLVLFWWKNGRLDFRRDVTPLLPFFGLAACAGLVTVWVETQLVGASGSNFDWSFVERLLLAVRIIWFYLGKLVWPAELIFYYEHWDVAAVASGWWLFLIASVSLTIALWTIRRRTRGPLAAWLLYCGSLFPVLGFFNVYGFTFSQVADHFQYLPCMVFLAAFTSGLATMLSHARPWLARCTYAGLAALMIVLGVRAHAQSALYVDNETLFRSVVARNPGSWMAHHNLGLSVSRTPGRETEAIAQFRRAIELNPEFQDSHLELAYALMSQPGLREEAVAEIERALELRPSYPEAHYALGVELARQPGRIQEAIHHFEEALKMRPRLVEARLQLANALARDPAQLPEAMAQLEEAVHIRPDYARAHNAYGVVLARLPGRGAEAIRRFEQALDLDPNFTEAHYNLAGALADMPGRAPEAISHFDKALQIDPESALAHYGLANVLARQSGRVVDALSHYEVAIRLQPEFAEAHANLANVLVRMPGRFADAIAHYEAALRIDPSLAWVHFNLALNLAQFPDHVAEAVTHYEKALEIKPDYPDALNGLAILFAQQARYEEAKERWERALEIDPEYRTARENLRLLEEMISKSK